MKKAFNVLFIGALVLAVTSCASNQRLPQDLSGITCSAPEYKLAGQENLEISFTVEVPANYFERRVTFTLMPAIRFANDKVQKLPTKAVQGTSVVDTNYPVVDWSVNNTITYKTVVPYTEALSTAVLDINGRIYNCLSKGDRTLDIAEYPIYVQVVPVCFPVPSPFALKEANDETVVKGKVYFRVNQYNVTSAEAAQSEISQAINTLGKLIRRGDFTINKIEIEGNASPEGTQKINNPLANNRANHTKDYVARKIKEFGYTKSLDGVWDVKATSGMGFWDQFYTAIRESSISNKEALADQFLSLHNNPEAAERAIREVMASNPEVKNLMLPILRYGAVAVYFEPLKLTVAELTDLAKNSPEALSTSQVITSANNVSAAEAVEIYKRGLRKYPDSYELYINLADAYTKLGMYDKTQETLAIAAKVAPSQDYVNLCMAYMNIMRNDFAQAKRDLENVDGEMADYYRGIIALNEGRYDDAVEYLKGNPDVILAVAQLNAGNAKDALQTLLNLDQEDAMVLYLESIAYRRLNELEKAIELEERANSIDPCVYKRVFCHICE